MTSLARVLVSAVAVLAVLLTAGVVGGARGQAMAAGEIVICANGSAVAIPVDAEGNPTGPPHWCPDCVLLVAAGVAPGSSWLGLPTRRAQAHRACGSSSATGRPLVATLARGPPAA